jgi:Na+-transporting methylmalonyl-CoA/oxaloacetate decarboxylase gamma subunit
MYPWLIFLHVISAFAFFLAHGATATVMFRLRSERDPARLMALLDLSPAVSGIMGITLLLLLVTGILAGFMGRLWGRGWIWAALILLIAITFMMSFIGRLYFDRVRHALGKATDEDQRKKNAPPPALTPDELAAVINAGRPTLLAVIGLGGLAVITWLMMFKPF